MYTKKEIIVVAPKEYANLARKIVHQISKHSEWDSAFWSIKHYEDNEFLQGGKRYAIFIGNENENPLTKDFLPVIDKIHTNAGACFGFDGPKAVVFGEGKLEQEGSFKQLINKCNALKKKSSKLDYVGATIATAIAATMTLSYTYIIYLPVKYIMKKKRMKILRLEQAKFAASMFFAEHFDAWTDSQNGNKK